MQNEQAQQPQRQSYVSPSLAAFGSVRDLTAAGSQNTKENTGSHTGFGYKA
jgi:hypothetical protein